MPPLASPEERRDLSMPPLASPEERRDQAGSSLGHHSPAPRSADQAGRQTQLALQHWTPADLSPSLSCAIASSAAAGLSRAAPLRGGTLSLLSAPVTRYARGAPDLSTLPLC